MKPLNSFKVASFKLVKSWSNKEFEEKKAKGICYWCEVNLYSHKCPQRQNYMLEVEGMELEEVAETAKIKEINLEISIHALTDTWNHQTMRFRVGWKKRAPHSCRQWDA